MVYGGYSKTKVKRDVDQGTVHQDAYLLSQESKHFFFFFTKFKNLVFQVYYTADYKRGCYRECLKLVNVYIH